MPGYEGHGGHIPAEDANQDRRAEIIRIFLAHGADPNATDEVKETPIYRAANLGYPDVAIVLLNHSADPNVANRKGHTPLHRTAMRGKAPIVPILLEHGADVSAEDREGKTPIDYARNKKIRADLEAAG